MRYRDAKKLHSEDEVTVKKSGDVFAVVDVIVDTTKREVFVMSHDGTWWRHTKIR